MEAWNQWARLSFLGGQNLATLRPMRDAMGALVEWEVPKCLTVASD